MYCILFLLQMCRILIIFFLQMYCILLFNSLLLSKCTVFSLSFILFSYLNVLYSLSFTNVPYPYSLIYSIQMCRILKCAVSFNYGGPFFYKCAVSLFSYLFYPNVPYPFFYKCAVSLFSYLFYPNVPYPLIMVAPRVRAVNSHTPLAFPPINPFCVSS